MPKISFWQSFSSRDVGVRSTVGGGRREVVLHHSPAGWETSAAPRGPRCSRETQPSRFSLPARSMPWGPLPKWEGKGQNSMCVRFVGFLPVFFLEVLPLCHNSSFQRCHKTKRLLEVKNMKAGSHGVGKCQGYVFKRHTAVEDGADWGSPGERLRK